MESFFRVPYPPLIENRVQPFEVVLQSPFNLWLGITVGATYDVHRLTQSEIVKRRHILFRVLKECPLCPARMEQIVIHPISLLGVRRLPYLPGAVETLHVGNGFIPD